MKDNGAKITKRINGGRNVAQVYYEYLATNICTRADDGKRVKDVVFCFVKIDDHDHFRAVVEHILVLTWAFWKLILGL